MHIDATCTKPDVLASTPEGTTRRPRMPFAGERNASATLAPLAIKGGGGLLSAKRPIWPKRPSKAAKGKVNLFSVGIDASKEAVFARLKREDPGAGYCHFPMERDVAYFEQLTAERLRTRYVKGYAQQFWPERPAPCGNQMVCATKHSITGSTLMRPCMGDQAMPVQHGPESEQVVTPDAARAAALPPVPLRRQSETVFFAPIAESPRRRRRAISSKYM